MIVLPARWGSTRLPGKPLLDRTGKPLIQHVWEAAVGVKDADVLVATDDERIAAAVRGFGGEAVMTDAGHTTGSARIAEAARGTGAGIVVNLQGDEPEVDPGAVEALIELHAKTLRGDRPAFVSTLAAPFPADADPADPNAVKVALSQPDEDGIRNALYFSRSRIPYPRGAAAYHLHIGLYAYTPETLQAFAATPPTPLEGAESLEQLRVLETGGRIAVGLVEGAAAGIDTPEDYETFVLRTTG
nr:3-deoxy-manno-octulosonate cytidylyltransferase [Parvularcula dongshanensis]